MKKSVIGILGLAVAGAGIGAIAVKHHLDNKKVKHDVKPVSVSEDDCQEDEVVLGDVLGEDVTLVDDISIDNDKESSKDTECETLDSEETTENSRK